MKRGVRVGCLGIFIFSELVVTLSYLHVWMSTAIVVLFTIIAILTFLSTCLLCARECFKWSRLHENARRLPPVPELSALHFSGSKLQTNPTVQLKSLANEPEEPHATDSNIRVRNV